MNYPALVRILFFTYQVTVVSGSVISFLTDVGTVGGDAIASGAKGASDAIKKPFKPATERANDKLTKDAKKAADKKKKDEALKQAEEDHRDKDKKKLSKKQLQEKMKEREVEEEKAARAKKEAAKKEKEEEAAKKASMTAEEKAKAAKDKKKRTAKEKADDDKAASLKKQGERDERMAERKAKAIRDAQVSLRGTTGRIFSSIVDNPILGRFKWSMEYQRQLKIWLAMRKALWGVVTLIGLAGSAYMVYMCYGFAQTIAKTKKLNEEADSSSSEPVASSGPAVFNATTGLWVDANTGATRTPPRLYSGADLSWFVPFTNKEVSFTDTMVTSTSGKSATA